MPRRLTLCSAVDVTLDEINGPWTWMLVREYAFEGEMSSEECLAALLKHPSFVTAIHDAPASHGPYLVEELRVADFEPADRSSVERHFGDWIENEGPTVPLDPEPILEREIRPRLTGDEFYILKDLLASDRPVKSSNVETLAGWVEAVVVDRAAKRLRTIACGSD